MDDCNYFISLCIDSYENHLCMAQGQKHGPPSKDKNQYSGNDIQDNLVNCYFLAQAMG